MLKYLVIVGALVQLIGIFSYIKDTIKGNTKPNKVSWLMWSIAPLIATVAAFYSGVRWAVLPVFMSGFAPLLVFIFSFLNSKSYWKLERYDYVCGLCSILALVLWGVMKEPLIAIVFAIFSDAFAAIPTIIKSWSHPETESSIAYSTGVFNSLTSFAAISFWSLSQYLFPVYLVTVNGLILVIIYRKEIFKNQ